MNLPKVSVIVPVYNVERYLGQALNSLVAQSILKDMEIILIDDGSTDGCSVILDEYAAKYENVLVYHCPNGGYGKAVNRGLKLSQGEYIAIFEPDDWIEADMYENLYKLAKKHDAEVVKSDFFLETNKGSVSENVFKSIGLILNGGRFITSKFDKEIFYVPSSIWSAIYKREFLFTNNIFVNETPGASYQDLSFSFKINFLAKRFYVTGDRYYHYRLDAVGSSTNTDSKAFCVLDELKEIKRYLCALKTYPMWIKSVVSNLMYRNYIWNFSRIEKDMAEKFMRKASSDLYNELLEGNASISAMSFRDYKLCVHYATAYLPETSPKISIIIPVFKTEKYLAKCLDSIIGQTEKDIEIICVNDKSPDNSAIILDKYSKKDKRLRVINHIKNKGLSSARNTGIDNAKAKYIMFCDSDDYYSPDMVEKMYNAILKNRADIGHCNINVSYEYKVPDSLRISDENYYNWINNSCQVVDYNNYIFNSDVSSCNKIFNRYLINITGLRFPKGLYFEDAAFFFYYIIFATNIYLVKDPLYNYVRRDDSIMNNLLNVKDDKAVQHWAVFEQIFEFYKSLGIVGEYLDILKHCCFAYLNFVITHAASDYEKGLTIGRAINFLRSEKLNSWVDDLDFSLTGQNKPIMLMLKAKNLRKQLLIKIMKSFVSIIIPVYNADKTVAKCLDSLIEQTKKNIEIICIDDASTDDSRVILETYAKKDSRIHIYFHSTNQGVAAARNLGLQNATGGYIMWCDPDDVYASDMVEKMFKAITSHRNIGFAMCGIKMEYQIEVSDELRQSDEEYYNPDLDGFTYIDDKVFKQINKSLCNKIFNVELINYLKLKFPNGLLYEDAYFVDCYLTVCGFFYFVNERLYTYIRHTNSIMSKTFFSQPNNRMQHWIIAEKVYEFYDKMHLSSRDINRLEYIMQVYYNFSVNGVDRSVLEKINDRVDAFTTDKNIQINKW
jgi:glycosyltransferase involved in cell wall biosynthesis